ncbi:MAG: lysophospholipase [candidate division FCPU426 bacterium]
MADLLTLTDTDILYRCWESAQPRAVLLLVHGLGAHAGRWQYLADYFQPRQTTIYAPDLKGFGATPGPRGHIDSFRQYDRDLALLLRRIKSRHPSLPVFLYGESMGGVIAVNFAAGQPQGLAGLILSSPVFVSTLSFPLADYLKVFSSLVFNPRRTISLPFNTAMCTSDPAVRQTMDADPLELRVASAKLLVNILLEQTRVLRSARQLQLPTLFLTAGQDQFGDNRAVRKVFERMPLRDKTFLAYPDMLHVLHAERERERVFKDVETWFAQRM